MLRRSLAWQKYSVEPRLPKSGAMTKTTMRVKASCCRINEASPAATVSGLVKTVASDEMWFQRDGTATLDRYTPEVCHRMLWSGRLSLTMLSCGTVSAQSTIF